jgi:hypothetical protein
MKHIGKVDRRGRVRFENLQDVTPYIST